MELWNGYVQLTSVGLAALAQVLGGSYGLAIIVLSLTVRFSLMPSNVRRIRRDLERKAQFEAKKAQLISENEKSGALTKKELEEQLAREMMSAMKPGDIFGSLIQMPIVGGLYRAVSTGFGAGRSFSWIANLAQPDALLTTIIGGFTFLAAYASVETSKGPVRWLIPTVAALVTMWFVRRLAAAVGLYLAATGFASVVQALILRQRIASSGTR